MTAPTTPPTCSWCQSEKVPRPDWDRVTQFNCGSTPGVQSVDCKLTCYITMAQSQIAKLEGELATQQSRADAAESEIVDAFDAIFHLVPERCDEAGLELSVVGKIRLLDEQLTAALTAKEGAERERDNQQNALASTLANINDTCRSRGFNQGPSGSSTEDRVIALAQSHDAVQADSQSLRERLAAVEKTALHYADERMNSHFRIAAEAVLEVLKPQ